MPLDVPEDVEVKAAGPRRRGFLPIETNLFDRFFISLVLTAAIHLLWLRFIEPFITLYVALAISVVLGVFIIRRG
ncbi:MAG: DUF2160 domain-containing protein [Anaerolineae bacterium]|jgi:predicted small integral membrane protein|nr:DUF2160 domain-containing protein [Anaerolineae bacterium]